MLVIGISSRALFQVEDGHRIYTEQGSDAFNTYMRTNERKPLRPGVAFGLVKKLLALNSPGKRDRVEVLLLSSNTLEAGARVMNSVRHYGLDIERAFFTSGGERYKIAKAGNVTLFLSTNADEVRKGLEVGIASARIIPDSRFDESAGDKPRLCIAFDGDSVLFDDSAERVNQQEGLEAFQASERKNSSTPLGPGPFKAVLQELHAIKQSLGANGEPLPLQVALVTARGVLAYDRVMCTFRSWGVNVDYSYFCGGLEKGPFLSTLEADLFFDDGMHNVNSASQFVPACHVPYGIVGSTQ